MRDFENMVVIGYNYRDKEMNLKFRKRANGV